MNWSIVIILLLLFPAVQAQVAVESFTSNPQKILPGEEVVLAVEIENVGEARAQDILVALDLSELPFVPMDSSTEKIIERIREDESERVYFKLRALPTAVPEVYKIPVTLSYAGLKQTSLLSQEVAAPAVLKVLLDNSNIARIGKQGKVSVKFVNNGLIPITYLTATLRDSPNYVVISSKSVYIGDVDTADFETEEFTLVPKFEDPVLALDLYYRDQTNQEYRTSAFVPLKVYTEEEAKQLGLLESTKPISIIVAVIILAVAIFYIVRRKRKKKHDA